MDFLPIFIDLKESRSLVIGAGPVANRKIQTLLAAQARINVVAKAAVPAVHRLSEEGRITLKLREYHSSDLDGASIVIAATKDKKLNAHIANDARSRNTPVNVVDDPALCSFVMPSIVDRDPVVIAISTGGAAPILARALRARLETLVPPAYGQLAALMGGFRARVREKFSTSTARRRFWEKAVSGSVAERLFEGKHAGALRALENLLNQANDAPPTGEVYLVGGGPGDPDLLTFRALRLMQQADVVVYDRLVAPEIVELCRKDADRIFVGKQRDNHALNQDEISALLVKLASEGRRVIRLKGGDPFIFGRGGEEIATLAANGIAFQIVPGITAASGCAAYAGIPLTHRDYAQQCLFITAHHVNGQFALPWDTLTQERRTIAVYMGMQNIEQFCRELIDHGMSANIPAAIVERGTTREQRVLVATLKTLAAEAQTKGLKSPAIIIIGEVVRLRQQLAWFESATELSSLL